MLQQINIQKMLENTNNNNDNMDSLMDIDFKILSDQEEMGGGHFKINSQNQLVGETTNNNM